MDEVIYFFKVEVGSFGVKRYMSAVVRLPWYLAEQSVQVQVLELSDIVEAEKRKSKRTRRTLRRNGMKITGARPLSGVDPHELEMMTPTSSEAESDEFVLDKEGMNLSRAMREGRVGQVIFYNDEQRAMYRLYLTENHGRTVKRAVRILEEIKSHDGWREQAELGEDMTEYEELVRKDVQDLYHEMFLSYMKVYGREKAILDTCRWVNVQVRNGEVTPVFDLDEEEERLDPMGMEEKCFLAMVATLLMPGEPYPRRAFLEWDDNMHRVIVHMKFKQKPKVFFTQWWDEREELREEFWLRVVRLGCHLATSAQRGHLGPEAARREELWLVTRFEHEFQINHFMEMMLRDIKWNRRTQKSLLCDGSDAEKPEETQRRAM